MLDNQPGNQLLKTQPTANGNNNSPLIDWENPLLRGTLELPILLQADRCALNNMQ